MDAVKNNFSCGVSTGELQDVHPEGGHDQAPGEKPQQQQRGAADALCQRHLQGDWPPSLQLHVVKCIFQKEIREAPGLPLTSPSGRPPAVWLCSVQETKRPVTSCPSTTASSRWSPCWRRPTTSSSWSPPPGSSGSAPPISATWLSTSLVFDLHTLSIECLLTSFDILDTMIKNPSISSEGSRSTELWIPWWACWPTSRWTCW